MRVEKVPLSEVSDYFTGKIESNKINSVDYISTTNMLENKKGISVNGSLPPALKINRFEANDILISNIRPYFKKIWLANKSGGCDADILNIRAKQEKVLPKYLYYSLFKDAFFDYVMVGAKGVKMPRGDKTFIMKYEIPLIPIHEQQKVISIISPIFDKIESNNRLIISLEEYSQLLFHKWFVDFNFPNENGEPYKDSGGEMVEVDGKMIPKSWQDIPLIDAAFFINGLAMQKFPPKNELDMLPVIKIKEINNNGYGKETEYVTKTIDKDLVVNDGDILFPWSGSLSVNIWTGGVGGLNQHIFKVKSDKFDKWFIYLWLKNHMRFFEKIAYGKKTTMGHINRKHLGHVNVLVPEKHTLKVMNELMNPIFNKIVSLNIENRKLIEYRDLLICKLIK